jgi:hypothetical protein
MHRRLIGIVATLVAVALGTAACGGGSGSGGGQLSHDEYQQKITQIAADFKAKEQDSLGSLQNIKTPDDLAKVGDTLRKGADAIDNVADELDSLSPPADAADANAKYVSGFHGTADALRQLADAADAKDFAKLQSVGQEFQSSQAAKDLKAADAELRTAGYTVPNPSSTT